MYHAPKRARLDEQPCVSCLQPTARMGMDHVLCDGCNDVWHLTCAGLEELPVGPWHCARCLEGYCERGIQDVTLDASLMRFVHTGEHV